MIGRRPPMLFVIAVTAVLAAAAAGGAAYHWQNAKVRSLDSEIGTLTIDLGEVREELTMSDLARAEQVAPMKQRVRELEDKVKTLQEYPEGEMPLDLLTVYTSTEVAPDNPIPDYHISVRASLSVTEKLRILASRLSSQRFSSLPIDIVGVKSVKGKRIATIDLQELNDDIHLPMWWTSYFQGSTGGGLTQTTLVYTFLQKRYRGEWVDGVQFRYKGQPATPGDHIDLSGTFFRSASK